MLLICFSRLGFSFPLNLALVAIYASAYPQQPAPGDPSHFILSDQTLTASPSSATATADEISGLEDLMQKLGGPVSKKVLSSFLPGPTQSPETSLTNTQIPPQPPELASNLTSSTYLDGTSSPIPPPRSDSSNSPDDSKSGAQRVPLDQSIFTIIFCFASAAVGFWLI
ncbi:hypothetical protein CROQUDRAFT_316447 [Cronartium quercuum f. sp. fusiforme G11]|uniref:Uncharacterized protein n=1 Tax=Cronartium quercuum f. sp. fusiforme G11 TaxID=708437 RepID=A0A9P6NV78_9BASI|nr:hypothetical protein CROQUDRAFT_316447 [Cronartium quercuum f. sp. fusiforme G11]